MIVYIIIGIVLLILVGIIIYFATRGKKDEEEEEKQEEEEIEENKCEGVDCKNGGTVDLSTCNCNCVGNWMGDDCSKCELVCLNDGKLNLDTCSCDCHSDFTGNQCQTMTEEAIKRKSEEGAEAAQLAAAEEAARKAAEEAEAARKAAEEAAKEAAQVVSKPGIWNSLKNRPPKPTWGNFANYPNIWWFCDMNKKITGTSTCSYHPSAPEGPNALEGKNVLDKETADLICTHPCKYRDKELMYKQGLCVCDPPTAINFE